MTTLSPSVDKEALFYDNYEKSNSEKSTKNSAKNLKSPDKENSKIKFVLPPSTPQNENSNSQPEEDKAPSRFDWIQKTDSITIIFYTKAFRNPQVEVTPITSENNLEINLTYENKTFCNKITFLKSIQWPCNIRTNYETGKIEVVFKKLESKIWENFGELSQMLKEVGIADKIKYVMLNKQQISHNTYLMEFKRIDGIKATVPIGKHVRVFGKIKGEEISRSYTPVPSCLFNKYKIQSYTTDNVCLMVKSYQNGNLSKYICSRNKDDVVEISSPLGNFDLKEIEKRESFIILAAGTGITPMLGLLLFLLERRTKKW